MSRPRVGFLGVGWIGRHRMEAMVRSGAIEAVAICDPAPDMLREARRMAPEADVVPDLDSMLTRGLDGIVIATPSALHADQSIQCLKAGVAVFCQKPLGRSAEEVSRVVAAARSADRLLMVDFSYRQTRAMREIVDLIHSGRLGHVFAIDLVFHNAYGPDKPWFYDRAKSGGGCLMDLGSHLVDVAQWAMGCSDVSNVSAMLFANGQPLGAHVAQVEDYAIASFSLSSGAAVRLACSWRLHAGTEAVIKVAFYGTEGGAALRNLGGSFYDFEAVRYSQTAHEHLVAPPDAWGGRAAVAWAELANASLCFRPEADTYVAAAATLDRIYAAAASGSSR